jgi:hypothetical protein
MGTSALGDALDAAADRKFAFGGELENICSFEALLVLTQLGHEWPLSCVARCYN